MNINRAQEFIYRNARPLDLARWQYLFENGSVGNVLNCLKMYQNEDGGFGHALEPDCWNPESSPIQTWVATEIIREINLKEKDHPMIQGILRYLETTKDFDGHRWANTVSSNDRYPHAPWWNYSSSEDINYNPTASLTGFVLRNAKPESCLYQTAERLLKEAYVYFKENCPLESMHTASCFVELYEDLLECGVNVIDLKEFEDQLHIQIAHVLTTDTSVWTTEYVCKPSLFIHSTDTSFYAKNKEICDYECRFLSETQESDGAWKITWDWGCCPEQWHISKNWWKSDLILKNIKFYQNMQG